MSRRIHHRGGVACQALLSRHKFKTVHVTTREAAETALNVLETLVSSAVKQLAQDVLQDIFSEITQANYGDPQRLGGRRA